MGVAVKLAVREFVVRWREVAIVALVLFAINLGGRIWAKNLKAANDLVLADRQAKAGFAALGLIGLVFFAMALYWGRERTMWKTCTELGFAAVAASLLSVFVAPPLVGKSPFAGGAGNFFAQFWWWGGLAIVGVGLAYIVLVAFTIDHRSKQLKRYADRAKAQPKRV
jgi:amino acid permease